MLDGVASLVDKSLLVQRQQADGDTRVAMLETIREYAQERLVESGEADATRRAHAAYCVVLAEEADAGLVSGDREAWLTRMDLELDNCRAALDWLVSRGEREWAVRVGLGLFRYWETRGLFLEAGTRLEALLGLPEETSGRWAKLQLYAGITQSNFGAFDAAQRLFERSLTTSRRLGDRPAEAVTLNNIGVSEHLRGRYAEATAHLEAALDVWTTLRDESAIARTSSNLGNVALDAGDLARARERYTEVLKTFTAKGDRESTAWALCHLGTVAAREGNLDEARRWFERAIEAFNALGMTLASASATADLGTACVENGHEEEGRGLLCAALGVYAGAGHTRGIARTFEELALAAARAGQNARALRLAGAAASLRRTVGAPSATERTRLSRVVGPLVQADVRGEFERGRALALDAAVTMALEDPA